MAAILVFSPVRAGASDRAGNAAGTTTASPGSAGQPDRAGTSTGTPSVSPTKAQAEGTAFHAAVPSSRGKVPPRTVLLANPELIVEELSAGDVEEKVKDWSDEASQKSARLIRALAKENRAFDIVDDTRLSPTEKTALQQHSALYDRMLASINSSRFSSNPEWKQRVASFDYTLGPGMRDIAARSGADAVLFVIGNEHVSSGGRKARMAGGVLMGILLGATTGVAVFSVPGAGVSFLSLGLVDMRTGDLLWVSADYKGGGINLRNEQDLKSVLAQLFATYPGLAQPSDQKNAK